jgi:hypothetical protein
VDGAGETGAARIEVEVFNLGRPVSGKGILDTAADGPTGTYGRFVDRTSAVREIHTSICDAARHEGQPPICGISHPAAGRSNPCDFLGANDADTPADVLPCTQLQSASVSSPNTQFAVCQL